MEIDYELQDAILKKNFERLGMAIVAQAVTDWRELLKEKKAVHEQPLGSFSEIRKFLKSDYCEMLSEFNGKAILKILEREKRVEDRRKLQDNN